MAEVKLPLVGGVNKKALVIGGVGATAVVAFIWLRKRNSSSSTAAATDTSGTDTSSTDGSSDYVDSGLQDTTQGPTYGATGYYDPNTGQWVYGNSGTGQALATTNAQWSQNAISYLAGSGVDTSALSAALGAYLTGQPVTSDQVTLIDQAIAAEGYPPVSGPNGYPPGINESGTASQGGTGGSGGGVTGGGGSGGSGGSGGGTGGSGGSGGGSHPITATVSGLHVTKLFTNSAQVSWSQLHVPAGQGPLTGYGVAAYDSAGHLVNGPFKVTSTVANIGGLHSKTKYHVNVWADPAKTGGPHATVSFTTK